MIRQPRQVLRDDEALFRGIRGVMPICFGPQEMRVATMQDARNVRVFSVGASCSPRLRATASPNARRSLMALAP
jgi:hypothetical protein